MDNLFLFIFIYIRLGGRVFCCEGKYSSDGEEVRKKIRFLRGFRGVFFTFLNMGKSLEEV